MQMHVYMWASWSLYTDMEIKTVEVEIDMSKDTETSLKGLPAALGLWALK